MTSTGIPLAVRGLLRKLYFLSMIPEGKKPCFTDMTFVDADSWFGAFQRTRYHESKDTIMMEIENIIDETSQQIESCKDPDFIKILIEALAKAKEGINRLFITYEEYPNTKSKLNVCLASIQIQLDRYYKIRVDGTLSSRKESVPTEKKESDVI